MSNAHVIPQIYYVKSLDNNIRKKITVLYRVQINNCYVLHCYYMYTYILLFKMLQESYRNNSFACITTINIHQVLLIIKINIDEI